jgi:hypothetical protein
LAQGSGIGPGENGDGGDLVVGKLAELARNQHAADPVLKLHAGQVYQLMLLLPL